MFAVRLADVQSRKHTLGYVVIQSLDRELVALPASEGHLAGLALRCDFDQALGAIALLGEPHPQVWEYTGAGRWERLSDQELEEYLEETTR